MRLPPRHRRRRARRGMAVLMVILLLSMTLGLTYAMVRSQNTAIHIERNADARAAARQAAITGATLALKKMQSAGWAGVETTLAGTLSATQGFRVRYTAGDDRLTPAAADYAEHPFRVTLVSTGTAADPADDRRVATHRLRVVVRLVPRALATEPNDWESIRGHTLFQYAPGEFVVEPPLRIVGKTFCDWTLMMGFGYNWSNDAREDYLVGLAQMAAAGGADWRPFNGPVNCYRWLQEPTLWSLLNTMGIERTSIFPLLSNALPHAAADSYRLYPGGPTYNAGTLPQECGNHAWTADPVSNPLGLFVRYGRVELNDNAAIRGTIATRAADADVSINGQGVQLQSVDLPPLYGSTAPVRLPLVMAADDFRIRPDARGTLQGMVAAAGAFEIEADRAADIEVELRIRAIAREFFLRGRSDWQQTAGWWATRHDQFQAQRPAGIPHFPAYLQQTAGLAAQPRIVVSPESAEVRYCWNNLQNPIYAAHAADGGLRFEVLDWEELR